MATEIKTLEPTQRLAITTQPQNYVDAYTQYAQSSNLLGELGASVALNSSIQYNKMQGEKLGLNPQGDIFPPITAADKAFAEGYIAQSNATLSLQANKMMMEGQLDLDKAYQLSPDMIQSYASNMQQGLDKIIQQAPTQLQNDLRNNFSQSLMQQTGQLTKQYISQSKERETDIAQANLKLQLKSINDLVMSGNEQEAEKKRKQIIAESNARSNTGMYSPTTAQTAKDSADTAYYTAREIKNAEQAIRDKRLPEYLDSIAMANVQGRKPTESDAIKANVYNYANKIQAMRQQEQTLLMAQAGKEISEGTFSDIRAAQYQATLDPINYLNVMTRLASSQRKNGVNDAIIQAITSNPTNALSYVGATKKQVNTAFDSLVQTRQNTQKGSESPEQSMLSIASEIPRPIPKVIDSINAALSSGNPSQMNTWGSFYGELQNTNPLATTGVSDDSLVAYNLYKSNLNNPTYKNDPNLAAAEAVRQVYNKDETQTKNNTKFINNYFNDKAKSPEKLSSWAINISGLDSSSPIFNRNGFDIDMQNQFKSFMFSSNNNIKISEQLTAEYAQRKYGNQTYNGSKETAAFPVGKMIGLEYGADGLIQFDATTQLEEQFDTHKKLFDEGKYNYYYRLKNKPNYEEYLNAKNQLREKGLLSTWASALIKGVPDKEYKRLDDIVSNFESPKPLVIEQVGKSGAIKEMQLFIQPSPNMYLSNDGRTIGGYLAMTVDLKTGVPVVLSGAFGPGKTTATYNPNAKWIRDNYLNVNGIINMSWADYEKNKAERIEKAKQSLMVQRPFF